MIEKGLKKEFIEMYCKKYDLDYSPKKENYALWETGEFITFHCNKCKNFSMDIKSLAHWKKTALTKIFECPGCLEANKPATPKDMQTNYKMSDLPLTYRLKLAKQSKWILKTFINVKEICIYECADCRSERSMLPHNVFLPGRFSCAMCKYKGI